MHDMDYLAIAPDIALAVGALAVLLVDITWSPRRRWLGLISGASIVLAISFGVVQWLEVAGDSGDPRLHFSGMLAFDGFAVFGGLVVFVLTGMGLASSWPLVERVEKRGAEMVALVLLAAVGFHLMAASANLILLFLGLEVASISLYVLAGFTRERADADESALKYFLLGAFASAIFLYGVALFFAGSGSLSLYDAARFLKESVFLLEPGVLLVGTGLMIVGLGFKVSAAPFHMWAPDVYQGAPGGIVGFLAAGAKVGGFAAMARILTVPLSGFIDDWGPPLAIIAAASIVLGTVLAIAQTDIKRMLAYSSVAHAGFIMTALVAGPDGIPAMWFYVATYSVQVIAAFGVASVVAGPTEGRSALTEYSGLGKRSPLIAQTMMLMMLAMGGIPLSAGFIGKVGVFSVAIDAGYLWLVIIGVVAAAAGLFFYLRLIVVMYMQAPVAVEGPGAAAAEPVATVTERVPLLIAVAATLAFGIVPWPLLRVAADAIPF